ncbi:4-hydroxy-3-methylbut-2-enyl diphosphate reductase [Desulforhopalus vacuolatus]|uniref:4-hydroxy-3-methylbut-2-enyl diphosphate reductase n=1 Tax=Desulforhopalus vacuolatus TaxID=40414 RepID=UPI0019632B3B|nr:4-hydroxy-3-methylbut-2-enyl diphosphate reductase [Desulforhopalus vacuolatus]MBM9520085.1 4-hydroxy-3-methylbut-2-enyl diphosphate reductase [Desulforhopalus vacuolatus]
MDAPRRFQVLLASPRGFCAGVERAIETVKQSLEEYQKPVYVLHEIVHNRHVIEELRESGAIFVEHLSDVPQGGVVIFSAHGVSKAVERCAADLNVLSVNATCPLVTSVHRMVERYHAEGCNVLIIGHHNHPEVEGSAGRVSDGVQVVASVEEAEKVQVENPLKVGYVTQTTLTQSDISGIITTLKRRFPDIRGPRSNICFATQNRQDAVRDLAERTELIFVVGSKNSSNSNRLKEVAVRRNIPAHLIDDASDIDPQWLEGIRRIGITAGASAPERLVKGVIDWLKGYGDVEIEQLKGVKEHTHFAATFLPKKITS